MRMTFLSRRSAIPAAIFAAGVALGGCSTDTLLTADDPDIIAPGQTASAEGAIGLANGALDSFKNITAGSESTWLFGGLLADEWSTSSTFPQNDETDQRRVKLDNSQVTAMLYRLYRGRTRAAEALTALNKYNSGQRSLIGEMYLAKGFAEMQLALDFCNGIPLSDFVDGKPVDGEPLTTAQVFAKASATLDSALAFADSTSARSVLVARAARITKARVLLALNQPAAAAALVTGIPTAYAYQQGFSLTTSSNTIWGQGLSARRYVIGDSLEGNARNILVRNALPFVTLRDPRLPVTTSTALGQDGLTAIRTTAMWGQLTPIDVITGLDARLIEAEAALALNTTAGTATWLSTLNALRAAPPKLGEVQPAALAALADPGNQTARVSLHFREAAFWTFSRGQRLGNLRRLIKFYGRNANDVFPIGTHYKGGDYGPDVNLPVVTDELNNPKFKGCTDRAA